MPQLRLRRTTRTTQPAPGPQHMHRGTGSRAVVVTVVRDEAEMLPRWVTYYGEQLGYDNLVVFDDNSRDGSTDDLPCTVHRLPELDATRVPFEKARMDLVSRATNGFLSWYDVAVFTDVDEFLVPDPAKHDGLQSYLAARTDRPAVGALGLNVVHHPSEGPIDASKPVLGQRRFAKFVPLMCKPAVKRVPTEWTAASHGIRTPFEVDPELFMLHLKFYDRDALRRTAEHRLAMVEADGRAAGSSWAKGGDAMVDVLDEAVAGVDPQSVPEFDPGSIDPSGLVIEDPKEGYRTVKVGQIRAMQGQPLVRIPERLWGLV
ncbi:MAG TPA: glycosyltransferase family 2 protein [Nocardioidaceae bacterium]|nr:glycosyltransferase family 2 protein [Nocardioidaceae bacterium]